MKDFFVPGDGWARCEVTTFLGCAKPGSVSPLSKLLIKIKGFLLQKECFLLSKLATFSLTMEIICEFQTTSEILPSKQLILYNLE